LFEVLELPPADPILSLGGLIQADNRPEKLNLGIGVYVDESGASPVMSAVREAERRVLESQVSKAYLSPQGNLSFLDRLGTLVFTPALWSSRISAMQTVGCVAALRMGAEVLSLAGVRRMWVSNPTWPIHAPIFAAAGLETLEYPYYEVGAAGVDWARMLESLGSVEPGDAVLLHGCCHNPTGADFTPEQWNELAEFVTRKQAIAFVDIAYAGLGRGWDEDLRGVRSLVERVEEAVVAVSCSKSFGVYRERAGALFFVGRDADQAAVVVANGLSIARTSYSMPPDHGAATVAEILGDPALTAQWRDELEAMRVRMSTLRIELADEAARAGLDWEYLRSQQGMFSLLPLSPSEVVRLRTERAIYMPVNARICIPGLSPEGIRHLTRSCAEL